MIPQLVLAGRPNVGKSTLFNKLTGARDALVANVPGLTRDRQYGRAKVGGKPCILIDTGGLDADGDFAALVGRQAWAALADAAIVLFIVDARAGLTASDQAIAADLRRSGRRVVLVVNKIDGVNPQAAAEFAALGFADQSLVSARQGRGLTALSRLLAGLLADPPAEEGPSAASCSALSGQPATPALADEAPSTRRRFRPGDSLPALTKDAPDRIRVAIIGRPNVGKSTLINRLVGEERQIVFDQPGTTRDAIDVPCAWGGDPYLLIDTAGVRRKGRVQGVAEKFSVVQALRAMRRAETALLLVDGREGLVDQDLHVLKIAIEAGAGLVIAANKWDLLGVAEKRQRQAVFNRRLEFAPWTPLRCISALEGAGVGRLMEAVKVVSQAGRFEVGTTALNRVLQGLLKAHPPPTVRGRRIKLRYAHRLGGHPPSIGIHGNQTEALPASYVRYLENGFREAFNLVGSPVRIELKTTHNPYAGKRNPLTPRQQRRRQRLLRHRRGR